MHDCQHNTRHRDRLILLCNWYIFRNDSNRSTYTVLAIRLVVSTALQLHSRLTQSPPLLVDNMSISKTNTTVGQNTHEDHSVLYVTQVEHNKRDEALDFFEQNKNDEGVRLSHVPTFTRGLRRRIDARVMPFLCLIYTMTFLDKVLLNVRGIPESVMGCRLTFDLVRSDHGHARCSEAQGQRLFQRISFFLHRRALRLFSEYLVVEQTSCC